MSGLVKVQMFMVPGVTVADLVADACPWSARYGEICQRYDPGSGELKVCPYWYGLRIFSERGYAGEARTPEDARQWLSTHELGQFRQYQVLCLAAHDLMEPGAARPR